MSGRCGPCWLVRLQWGTWAAARAVAAAVLVGALGALGAPTANAHRARATIAVNTTSEANADGLCSLREAVAAANTDQSVDGCDAGGLFDVIAVPEGTYLITQGALVFESSTVLRGSGAVLRRVIDFAEPYWREAIVRVASTAHLELAGVTLDGSGGCGVLVNEGNLRMIDGSITGTSFQVPWTCSSVAFYNTGAAKLLRTSIRNNQGDGGPTAFTNNGTLRIVDGLISGNGRFSGRFGLGAVTENSGVLSLSGTTYRENGPSSLFNLGTLTMRNCSFQGGQGIGLWNEGDAYVVRSSFNEHGTGIRNSGSLRASYSSIDRNSNSGFFFPRAAGIESTGTLVLDHSSVTENRGTGTGGILSDGITTVRDTTIAGNVAASWWNPGGTQNSDGAGGVTVGGGTAKFNNVTIADNHYEASTDAPPPLHVSGGLYVAGGSVSIANSVVALNQHDQAVEGNGMDCTGPVSSLGYTYLQRLAGCSLDHGSGDLTGGNPQLGALGRNGGPTPTMVPLPGSPLVDQGSPAKVGVHPAGACSRHDQRGHYRPADGDKDGVARCDIGAVERRPSHRT